MSLFARISLFLFVAILASGPVGCRKRPKHPTPIPGYAANGSGGAPSGDTSTSGIVGRGAGRGGTMGDGGGVTGRSLGDGGAGAGAGAGVSLAPTPLADLDTFEGRAIDRAMFKGNTTYFDFDRSTIKKSEMAKLAAVAEYLKTNPGHGLLIEGHCDERGTEEYNRALGERRALSAREYIVNQGVGAERIRTISYGEDRPAVDGHDEAAWSKNRRAEYGLLAPAAAGAGTAR